MKIYQFKLALMPAEIKNEIPALIDGASPINIHYFEASSKDEIEKCVAIYATALTTPCIAVVDHAGEGYPPIWLKHFQDQSDCYFNV